jgi:hypothetical protein
MASPKEKKGEIAGRYTKFSGLRETYLSRARDCALLTIPTLVPPSGNSQSTAYKTPYQSVGARGVNNLASKLLLTLLPPSTSFFRLTIDDFELMKLSEQEGLKTQFEEAFSKIERSVNSDIETTGIRLKAFEAIKQLIVAGNVLLFLPPSGGMRVFRLDRYVTKRDPMGTVLENIVREDISALALSPEMRKAHDIEVDNDSPDNTYSLYTRIYLDGNQYKVIQELNGKTVEGSKGSYPKDALPWMSLRWTAVENEDYGRSFVEEIYGDLKSLNGLSRSILEAAAASAKVLILRRPNATISKKELVESESGDVINGNPEDIAAFQLEKQADMQVALQTAQDITQRLSLAFLLNTAVQRKGERVTAEEIRYMANELEDSLGGVYSVLSQEFQLPLVQVLLKTKARRKEIPPLPGKVKPLITTGLDALGRGHDLTKLDVFMQHLVSVSPEVAAQTINFDEYASRVATAIGVDAKGLIKTPEQRRQEQMQAMAAQIGTDVAPEIAKGAMQAANQPQN